MTFADVYRGRAVLVTGNTGFKGAWLTRWLKILGADIHGLALPTERSEDLFELARLRDDCHHVDGNIRSRAIVEEAFARANPEIVFHLAAQALVGRGFAEPLETIQTNVLGTAHVLECVREIRRPISVVIVTSDKCYANQDGHDGYIESDPLGGNDIYSASKGAAEVITAAYRHSYFSDGIARIATARAGNVIGPGDWAEGRLIPDAVRALSRNQFLGVKNPEYIRPWQHVLEPLSGYLWLAAVLQSEAGKRYTEAFNFGPESESCLSVAEAAEQFVTAYNGVGWIKSPQPNGFRETKLLRLRINKAADQLDWRPVWTVGQAIGRTAAGYRSLADVVDFASTRRIMDQEIQDYEKAASAAGLAWSA